MALAKQSIYLTEPLASVSVAYCGEAPIYPEEVVEREKAAYARGRQEAEEFAQKQIVEMRDEFLQAQENLFRSLETSYQEMTSTINQRMPDLILALVKRVWGQLEVTPEAMANIVEELLREISAEGESMEIILNPEDRALLEKQQEAFIENYAGLTLKSEEKLARGDCLVQSRFGLVDGRAETKLKKIEEELKGQ